MGLCKCPKKKVTSLFCFEHRVNVCDHCLVESHDRCVVQTYLQWLTDSDYDTNCTLCETPLTDRETIRLQCLHVFHWDCVDAWASRLPANTAPAGYRCPFCRDAVFPQANQTSPCIEKLRQQLQKANWARAGLGLPLLPELERAVPPPLPVRPTAAAAVDSHLTPHPIYEAGTVSGNYRAATPATVLDVDDMYGGHAARSDSAIFTARKKQADREPLLSGGDGSSGSNNRRDADDVDNKYKRRPAGEWLSGLFKARYGSAAGVRVGSWRKRIFIGFLVVLAVVTVVSLMPKGDDSNPLFDPNANPNFGRVAADEGQF